MAQGQQEEMMERLRQRYRWDAGHWAKVFELNERVELALSCQHEERQERDVNGCGCCDSARAGQT